MIYVYEHKDTGKRWADFRRPRGTQVLKTFGLNTEAACRKVIKNPGKILPERVAGLAQRALSNIKPKDTFGRRFARAFSLVRACKILRGTDNETT